MAIAGLLASQARDFRRQAVTAPGRVVRLNAGPLHVDVVVTPIDAPSFVYAENGSRTRLR